MINIDYKMINKHDKYYEAAIDTWTKRDLERRDCAIKHNLNYVVLWNKTHIEHFFKLLDSGYEFTGYYDFNEEKHIDELE